MSSVPPPHRPRGTGDGWVELPDGRRFWGRAGAAGLLVTSPSGSVLLQHRVAWSHFGGTWGLPGGARDVGESALAGALREAREETGIDTASLQPRFAVQLDLDVWSYTTVAASAPAELAVHVADQESVELAWVPAADVAQRELHPGFAGAWPRLAELLGPREALVVDAANVVGSRPDGWWRDRPGAAERLLAGLESLAAAGIPADGTHDTGALPVVRRWPEVLAVLEGDARAATHDGAITVARAERDGDSAILEQTERLVAARRPTTVVTADRGLAERVRTAGAVVLAPGRLLELLP